MKYFDCRDLILHNFNIIILELLLKVSFNLTCHVIIDSLPVSDFFSYVAETRFFTKKTQNASENSRKSDIEIYMLFKILSISMTLPGFP